MRPLELFYEDATMREAFSRNVHFAVWYDAPSADQMRQYGRGARALHARYPDGSALMNLIVSGTPRFSSEVRDLAREYTNEGLHSIGTAHVVLVAGLLGSSVRAFLGTTVLLGRPPNPTKVFGTVDAAARWMAANLASAGREHWTADELVTLTGHAVAR